MRYPFQSDQKGFALIESMVSVAVIGIGALALTKLQGNVVNGNSLANQKTEAAIYAQEKIEALRANSEGSAYTNTLVNSADAISGKTASFTRTWTTTEYTNPNYKKINVTVAWNGMDNTSQSVVLSSVISESDNARVAQLVSDRGYSVAQNDTPAEQTPSDNTGDTGTTTTYSPDSNPDIVLVVDNATSEVLTINNQVAFKISGQITVATGGNAPQGNVDLSGVTINANTTSSSEVIYCTTTTSSTLATFDCRASLGWSGTLNVSGVSGVKVCVGTAQPYSNILENLTNQSFQLFKSSRSCSGDTPIELGVL